MSAISLARVGVRPRLMAVFGRGRIQHGRDEQLVEHGRRRRRRGEQVTQLGALGHPPPLVLVGGRFET